MSSQRTDSLVRIECKLSDKVVTALTKDGLDVGTYHKPCTEWRERREGITKKADKVRVDRMSEWDNSVAKRGTLDKEVVVYLIDKVLEQYP